MTINILAFNFGGSSTKVSVYRDNEELFTENIYHPKSEIQKFTSARDQIDYRIDLIKQSLDKHGVALSSITAMTTRGGPLPPVDAGAYEITPEMIEFHQSYDKVDHPTLTGTTIVGKLIKETGLDIKGYLYDSESIDQMIDIAKISGTKHIKRESVGHFLNIRAATRQAAKDLNLDLDNSNFIVAHLGSGNTVAAIRNNQIIDILSEDEGPYSTERAGGLRTNSVVNMSYSNDQQETNRMIRKEGGLFSYFGTNDAREVEKLISEGDQEAALIYEALAYQVAKACGELAIPLEGKVDQIVLTGGLAHSDMLTKWIQKWTAFLADVHTLPGEFENKAMSEGVYRVLTGQEESKTIEF